MPPDRPAHLAGLTSVRFIVAVQVVVYHGGLPLLSYGPDWLWNIGASGFVGVSFFFVLSGFILAYTHFDAAGSPRTSKGGFWAARFARIYPVYLLGFVLGLPFFLADILERGIAQEWASTLLTSALGVTLTQSWVPEAACKINCPGWSLSVEAFFYFLFPAIGALLCGFSRLRLALVAVAFWLIAIAFPIAYLVALPDGLAQVSGHTDAYWLTALKYNPLVRLPEFIIGIALGRMFVLARAAPSTLADLRRRKILSAVSPLAILAVLAFGPSIPYPLLHNSLLALPIGVFVYNLAWSEGRVARVLEAPLFTRLGEASYTLYILHFPLWLLTVFTLKRIGVSTTVGFLPYLLAITLISYIVWERFEVPLRRMLRARLAPKPRGAAAVVSDSVSA